MTWPNDPNSAQSSSVTLGEIEVPDFWLQRSPPRFVNLCVESDLVKTHSKEINHAEFEFHIRLNPLTGKGTSVVWR
ncbi:MAG: hypothetical protein VXZ82_02420 [Planctomycetota bacterium]|nr:hypothetical protein [Planctomycetota bacterium]